MDDYLLTVFFDSSAQEQKEKIENLLNVLRKNFGQVFRAELVDIRKNPQLLKEEHILVTPTIIRKKPLPQKRIVGIPENMEQVISQLRNLD